MSTEQHEAVECWGCDAAVPIVEGYHEERCAQSGNLLCNYPCFRLLDEPREAIHD
jgi:hypothetical protein